MERSGSTIEEEHGGEEHDRVSPLLRVKDLPHVLLQALDCGHHPRIMGEAQRDEVSVPGRRWRWRWVLLLWVPLQAARDAAIAIVQLRPSRSIARLPRTMAAPSRVLSLWDRVVGLGALTRSASSRRAKSMNVCTPS